MPVDVKPIIYQLVVRYFGNTNTTNQWNGTREVNGCGRFADVTDKALTEIRRLGVTHLWLTGCLRQATLTDHSEIGIPPDVPDIVKGIAGSFYALRDCFDVCPDYAVNPHNRLEEFDALVERVHAAGMKALIDFIPNHVARSYQSVIRPDISFGEGDDRTCFFRQSNHFFYLVEPPGQRLQLPRPAHWHPPGMSFNGVFDREDGRPGRPPKATGNNVTSVSPALCDWYETVKLNYGYNFVDQTGHYRPRPRTWDVMDEVIGYWQRRGVDGFRCDFAHYVPPEAWTFLVSRARQRDPDAFFMAEAYPFPGSGDPITDMRQLVDAGFDGVYFDESYDRLKLIYKGRDDQDRYDRAMVFLPPKARTHAVIYLENHDERRVASPIVLEGGPNASGFGSAEAVYQLGPLQYLYSHGPVLMLNGQEVGEPGAGAEGFGGDDGRTSLFDYWCMPEFAKWVNRHAYDGGRLSQGQQDLRRFYAALLAVCQDPAVRANGYWGLKYWNRPERFADCPADLYSFARFEAGRGRMLVIVGNFRYAGATEGTIRIPRELAERAGLRAEGLAVRLILDRTGTKDLLVAERSRRGLIDDGFAVALPDQTSHVYAIE